MSLRRSLFRTNRGRRFRVRGLAQATANEFSERTQKAVAHLPRLVKIGSGLEQYRAGFRRNG